MIILYIIILLAMKPLNKLFKLWKSFIFVSFKPNIFKYRC